MRNDARTRLRVRLASDVRALHEKRRQDVIGILKTSGASLNGVPFNTRIWRSGTRVHLERFVPHAETGNPVWRDDQTGPVVEEFFIEPDHIPDWIPFD